MEDPPTQRSPSLSNRFAGLLRTAPAGMPFGLDYMLRGLAPAFEGPSVNEQQAEFNRRTAGMTPRQQLEALADNPVAQQLYFQGSTFGGNPRRLLQQWHGTSSPGAQQSIAQGGFTRGQHSELGDMYGTSVARDPTHSMEHFAEGYTSRMLRAPTDVTPGEVRNIRPGEYSAMRSGLMTPPENLRALALPQSTLTETEIFFPRASGGQSSLSPRGLTQAEEEALNRAYGRRFEVGQDVTDFRTRSALVSRNPAHWTPDQVYTLSSQPPTPAEALRLVQQQALNSPRTEIAHRYRDVTDSLIDRPHSDSYRLLFPEDMQRIADIDAAGRRLTNQWDAQRQVGRQVEHTAWREARPDQALSPATQARMGQQDNMYRDYVRRSDQFQRSLQDLPLSSTDRLAQQLVMRDLIEASHRTRTPFNATVDYLVPEMRSVGFSPVETRQLLREPEIVNLTRGRRADLSRELQRRREVIEMER